jgi:hypothetical protein
MKIIKFPFKPNYQDILYKCPWLAGKEVTLGELDDGTFVIIFQEQNKVEDEVRKDEQRALVCTQG